METKVIDKNRAFLNMGAKVILFGDLITVGQFKYFNVLFVAIPQVFDLSKVC
jgi:predicted PP-loop superfamily ATPase